MKWVVAAIGVPSDIILSYKIELLPLSYPVTRHCATKQKTNHSSTQGFKSNTVPMETKEVNGVTQYLHPSFGSKVSFAEPAWYQVRKGTTCVPTITLTFPPPHPLRVIGHPTIKHPMQSIVLVFVLGLKRNSCPMPMNGMKLEPFQRISLRKLMLR